MLSEQQLAQVRTLVSKFEALSPVDLRRYQETEVRTNFIDPLFAILGWPMDERSHVERETTVEEGKRPDYAFKIAGVPRLFLEAKPFRDDVYDQEETRKAITKAYNRGVPWVGVTNFSRLVLYDAQEELKKEPPRRVVDMAYEDYVIPDTRLRLLTPASVESRTLDEYAQSVGARRRVVPIEKRLYESMRGWRETLFNALYSVKQWKTEAEFHVGDEAIQRLLDRLIFLRNCEDRGIGGTDLRGLRNRIRSGRLSVHVTDALLKVFGQAAAIYDSELFQTDAIIDVLMRGMGTILDVPLAQVIEQLYSVPRSYSDYDFSQMEPDVLGQVYEQYLEYVPQRIRKLAAQPALPGMAVQEIELEAKRQRRKEHGIYYTPRWVVQYIVQQTVGRFLEENESRPDAIDDLAILDPACGSGSFLIRAYETLLEHHAARMGGDIGHLDTRTREHILRRNIYGVDLDPQAVEIARLNLLIRMVRQQELLPELKANVQHGNSLIDGDAKTLKPFFGNQWEEKHPFNWRRGFREVTEREGFDIIIGNPPYVRIQNLARDEINYFNSTYNAATGNYDLYCLFVERGLQLLRPGGALGFIIPNKFMRATYGNGLRSLLSKGNFVTKIVDFGHAQIFESGTNYTCLLFLNKKPTETLHVVKTAPLSHGLHPGSLEELNPTISSLPAGKLGPAPWVLSVGADARLKEKIESGRPTLSAISDSIFQGLKTGADKVYVLDDLGEDGGQAVVHSRALKQTCRLEPGLLRTLIKGQEMHRYAVQQPRRVVLFPYQDGKLIAATELEKTYPRSWQYLCDNRRALENREDGRWRGANWYGYSRIQNLEKFRRGKIVTPDVASSARYSFDPAGRFYFSGGGAGGYGIVVATGYPVEFVLGLLNSSLLDWYLHQISSPFRGGYHSYESRFIGRIPVEIGGLSETTGSWSQIATLVRRMIELDTRLIGQDAASGYDREQLEREVAATDREIDNLVFSLYGLTAAERALVESASSG